MPPVVLIADDHPICGTALSMAVSAAAGDAEVVIVTDFAGAEAAARARAFDLILLDLVLPDVQGMSGLLLLKQLQPAATFAIVSGQDDIAVMRRAAEHGARGFIPKSAPMDVTTAAVQALLAGGQWFPADVFAEPLPSEDSLLAQRFAELSAAQLRVLLAAADGRLNKQIAHDLGLAEATIKSHFAAIFRKLGVANRTQAVLAMRALNVTPA